MASDDLAIAHLRRFSIPLPDEIHEKKTPNDQVDSNEKKTPNDRDDSQNEDSHQHNESSRRHRRKKSKKKNNADLMNGDAEHKTKEKVEDAAKAMCDTSDNCTEGEGSTYREATEGESPEDDKEVPHRRLKIDNMYNGTRRRSSSGSSRRKSNPNAHAPHKLKKQKPVLPVSPDDSNENGLDDVFNSKDQLDETDTVYQADVSRTYESVSEYVLQSDVALLDTNCASNGYKRTRRKQSELNQTTNFDLTVDDDVNTARLKFALKVHLGFRSLGMMTHGLVAGFAIAQCIFVFSYSTSKIVHNTNTTSSAQVLLGNYSQVAVLFQSLYYLFLSISIVSILDRFINIDSDWTHLLQFLIARPLRAVALISYLLSFIFSVSLAELDDIINMYTSGPTKTTLHQANTWKVLNMFRVVTSIVGWVSVAFSPLDDVTCTTIENVLVQIKKEEHEKHLLSNAHSSPIKSL